MDANVSLVAGTDYTLGAALITSLGGYKNLTPAVLKASWHENGLRYAVDYLIQSVCFGHDPAGHADCQAEWDSWPETDWSKLDSDPDSLEATQYYAFFCHDVANQCGMCGHQWKGMSKAMKADPALSIKKGDVLVNRCPHCLEMYEINKGQRLRWREMVAGIIGAEVAAMDKTVKTVRTDMIFRLGRFMARGAMAAGSTKLEDADVLGASLKHAFAGMSIKDSTIYDVASWYARGPFALPYIVQREMEELEDAWTRNQMRQVVPLINEVYERLLKGDPIPDLSGIMEDESQSLDQRVETARALLNPPAAPEEPADPEAPKGILLIFADGSRFLVENWNGAPEAEAEHQAAGGRVLVHQENFNAVAQWLSGLFAGGNQDAG